MLLCVPDVLTKDEVAYCRKVMETAAWQDGRETAGAQAAEIKLNMQLPAESPAARELGQIVLDGLYKSPLFLSASLPSRIMPPMFNSYSGGQNFGVHVDNAIRSVPGQAARIRTDLSATLFLAEPEEYEGGELMIETLYGSNEVKLPAGHLVLYPATSLHCVTPVTAGLRRASVFWVQSMIREEGPRTMLFDLDRTIQELQVERGYDDPQSVRLTGIYHNLIRHWAET